MIKTCSGSNRTESIHVVGREEAFTSYISAFSDGCWVSIPRIDDENKYVKHRNNPAWMQDNVISMKDKVYTTDVNNLVEDNYSHERHKSLSCLTSIIV